MQVFVNTLDIENGVDELSGPAALATVLEEAGVGEPGLRPTAADARTALDVREALRALLLANNGEARDPAAQETLERAARRARLEPEFGAAALVPRAGGVDGAIGQVLAAAFAAMLDGSWRRLKACPREVCGWAFYDRSSNASATWCSMQVCGGRAKAGAYYRRRRAAGN